MAQNLYMEVIFQDFAHMAIPDMRQGAAFIQLG